MLNFLNAYCIKCKIIKCQAVHLINKFQEPVEPNEVATETDNEPPVNVDNSATQYPTLPSEYMPLVPSTRSWELKRTDINVIKIIGKGAFSRVAKATATCVRGVTGEITVAVKMLKGKQ